MVPQIVLISLMKPLVPLDFLTVDTVHRLCLNVKTIFVFVSLGFVMEIMTVAMVQMKNFTCALLFSVRRTVSSVTTTAVFTVMRCATMLMTAEMEVMRGMSSVYLRRQDLVEKMSLNVAMDVASRSIWYAMTLMTVGTILMKQVAIQEKKERVLKICVNITVPSYLKEDLFAPVDLGSKLMLRIETPVMMSMNVRILEFVPRSAKIPKGAMSVPVPKASGQ